MVCSAAQMRYVGMRVLPKRGLKARGGHEDGDTLVLYERDCLPTCEHTRLTPAGPSEIGTAVTRGCTSSIEQQRF